MVTSRRKGTGKDTSLNMVKEFALIERQEYNHPTLSENMNATSMLSIQQLLDAVKSRVGTMYHNKIDNFFEFLKTHPSILTWTGFGEAIVDGTRLPGSNVHDMFYFMIGENYLNNHHYKVWIS